MRLVTYCSPVLSVVAKIDHMPWRVALLGILGSLVFACGGDEPEEDFSFPNQIEVTITSNGATLSPDRVDGSSMYLSVTNETSDAKVLSVDLSGADVDGPALGLAPGETREEFVDIDPFLAATLQLDGLVLHVIEAEPEETITFSPRPARCPLTGAALKGYRNGFFDGKWLDRVSTNSLDVDWTDYLPAYGQGYVDGYLTGVAAARHNMTPGVSTEDHPDSVGYQRGHRDGGEDGFTAVRNVEYPPEYGAQYFEGYFDAVQEKDSLC